VRKVSLPKALIVLATVATVAWAIAYKAGYEVGVAQR